MHTVQLILRPTEYEKAVINKRFHAMAIFEREMKQ